MLPFARRRMVGPFIFLDQMGPVTCRRRSRGTLTSGPIPTSGCRTITYLFGGQITHRDSLGVEQVIRPGEVNWMTAGAASPIPNASTACAPGGQLDGIQAWVAVPEADEEAIPPSPIHPPDAACSTTAACGAPHRR